MANVYKLTLSADSAERNQYMRRMFPQAVGASLSDKWRGGRSEAIRRLNTIDIKTYNRNRNFLNGGVSHLSPYFRYGCLTLKEASDHLRGRYGSEAKELIGQMAWRDYSMSNSGYIHFQITTVKRRQQWLTNKTKSSPKTSPHGDKS